MRGPCAEAGSSSTIFSQILSTEGEKMVDPDQKELLVKPVRPRGSFGLDGLLIDVEVIDGSYDPSDPIADSFTIDVEIIQGMAMDRGISTARGAFSLVKKNWPLLEQAIKRRISDPEERRRRRPITLEDVQV